GNNLTVTASGTLTIGMGASEGILAAGKTVTLNASGIMEMSGSIITAANLRLFGVGPATGVAFLLDQPNVVSTFAALVSGAVNYHNNSDLLLPVSTVFTTKGINTGGGNLTLLISTSVVPQNAGLIIGTTSG